MSVTATADLLSADCTLTVWDGDPARCRWCDGPLTGSRRRWCSQVCVDQWVTNHVWRPARTAALVRDRWECVRCGDPNGLQVNHIEPLWGAGYTSSCHHHLTNLEALCQPHHRAETRRWAAVRHAFILHFAIDIATGEPAEFGWRPLRSVA